MPDRTYLPDLGPLIILIVCVSTYANTISVSAFLASLGGAAITADPLPLGVVYGLLGALLLRRVDIWRRDCVDETSEQACVVKDEELLEKGVLLGVAPVSIPAWGLLQDPTFGERSVSTVDEQCTVRQKAFLQITGSLASCFLVHGVLQQALCIQLSSTAEWVAISSTPADPSAAWWWPAVAAGQALAPAAAALAAAALEFVVYLLVCGALLPMANYEAQTSQEAISVERKRCARLFMLMGIPREAAGLRAEAFSVLAEQWERQQQECRRRREVTNFVRVLTAAAVYAASGGSILAPVLTNIAVTDSVLDVVGGRSSRK